MRQNRWAALLSVTAAMTIGVSLSSAEVDAANTKINKRDTTHDATLPEDQSNRSEYIERTAAIRKDLMDNDTLSTTAKNVKIITLDNGTVVLRGPVNSPSEKQIVESAARKHAPSSELKSYIEISKS